MFISNFVEYFLEKLEAVCRSKVDLPIPGSPPKRTADRLVAPPPRTRSNSSIPVSSTKIIVAEGIATMYGDVKDVFDINGLGEKDAGEK